MSTAARRVSGGGPSPRHRTSSGASGLTDHQELSLHPAGLHFFLPAKALLPLPISGEGGTVPLPSAAMGSIMCARIHIPDHCVLLPPQGRLPSRPGGTLKVTHHLAYGVSYAVEGYKQGARAWIKSIAATGLQP